MKCATLWLSGLFFCADVLLFVVHRLLKAWQDYLIACDADVITGYNINNFDIPYLLDRGAALKLDHYGHFGFVRMKLCCSPSLRSVTHTCIHGECSRVRGKRCVCKDTTFTSKAQGSRESKKIEIQGRVPFDMFLAISRDYKLSSYTLNAVSTHFLGDQKEVRRQLFTELCAQITF